MEYHLSVKVLKGSRFLELERHSLASYVVDGHIVLAELAPGLAFELAPEVAPVIAELVIAALEVAVKVKLVALALAPGLELEFGYEPALA